MFETLQINCLDFIGAINGSKTESNDTLSSSNQPIHAPEGCIKSAPLFRIARAAKQHSLAMSTNFKCSQKHQSRVVQEASAFSNL